MLDLRGPLTPPPVPLDPPPAPNVNIAPAVDPDKVVFAPLPAVTLKPLPAPDPPLPIE